MSSSWVLFCRLTAWQLQGHLPIFGAGETVAISTDSVVFAAPACDLVVCGDEGIVAVVCDEAAPCEDVSSIVVSSVVVSSIDVSSVVVSGVVSSVCDDAAPCVDVSSSVLSSVAVSSVVVSCVAVSCVVVSCVVSSVVVAAVSSVVKVVDNCVVCGISVDEMGTSHK